jgi:aldehyde dehydrogenase (NAD+)
MASQTIKINGKDISIPTGLFINNEFIKAVDGGVFPVENPSTKEVVLQVQEGQAKDVDVAVKAARKAFNSPAYRDLLPEQRGALLGRLADLMEAHSEEIIAIEMLDTGKTRMQVAEVDLPGALGNLRYYAGWADKLVGESNFNIPNTFAYTKREPIGVCGQIIPWKYVLVLVSVQQKTDHCHSFPLLMFIWKIAPALATGNTVIVKTAESTPLTALKIAEYIKEVGFPAGAVNVISGYGKTAGAALAGHMDVDKVAFTGSTATGRFIMKAAADSNLKKVTLELGGKSPVGLLADL